MEEKPIIEARGVYKSFGKAEVIHGIDFTLNKGEFLSVMGPSGSGKSTLLHCLAGITDIDKGSVVYGGRDMATFSQKEKTILRRTDFGFIFQFGELVPELSIIDNVALPLLLRGVKKKEVYARSSRWLDEMGISSISHQFPHTISGGEVQRVATARAMVIDPEVIFADEPTGSLDSVNARRIMELFVELVKKYDKSIVLITHSDELASYGSRTIRMRDGLIEDSPPAYLL